MRAIEAVCSRMLRQGCRLDKTSSAAVGGIAGFEAGQRVAVPISISGSIAEYFLPHPLAGVVAVTAIPPEASALSAALAAPWLLDAARYSTDGGGAELGDAFVADPRIESAFSALTPGAVDATRLRAAHGALMGRPQPSRYRDAIAWVNGRSPQHAKLVPPPSSAIDALMFDLAAFLARSDIPAWIRQALAYYQFIHIHPFADGNGRLSRMLVATIGARRTQAMIVALALTAHRKAFTRHFDAMQAGSTDAYLVRWHQLHEWAGDCASEIATRERELRAALSTIVGPNNGGRLFDLFASGVALSAQGIATALRWSAKNAPLHIARLRDDGWIAVRNGVVVASRVRDAQRDLVARIGLQSAPILL